jgi:hypothetical protein
MSAPTSERKHRRQSKGGAGNLLLVGLLMALVVALAAGLFWMLTSPSFLVPGR